MRNVNSFANRAKFALTNGLWRYALAVIVTMSVATTAFIQSTPPDPGKGATVAGFEVDGNFYSYNIPSWWNSAPGITTPYPDITNYGDDWSKGSGGGDGVLLDTATAGVSEPGISLDKRSRWEVDGNWGNQSTIADTSVFQGQKNKNDDNIAPGASPYNVKSGSSGPQKNDITNGYVHTREDMNGDTWLFFGCETRATNGNAYVDMEYNQAGVSVQMQNNQRQLVGVADSTNGTTVVSINGRTVDDFSIVINYTGGGNRPVIGVRKWLSTGNWSEELSVDALGAYITTNIKTIAAVAPGRGFTTDGAPADSLVAFQFLEGGVNISDLNLNLNLCSPNATVNFKSRSSSSFTAELKDFLLMPFSILPGAQLAIAEDDVSICPGESVEFNAGISGAGALASNVKWYQIVDNPSTDPDTTELTNGTTPTLSSTSLGGTVSISASGDTSTLQITNLQLADSASYYLLAVLTGADCGMPSDKVQISLNTVDTPKVLLTEPSICGPKTGSMKVCNVLDSAKYILYQFDTTAVGPPVVLDTVYADTVVYVSGYSGSSPDTTASASLFTGLKPGYGFLLTVISKEGCSATADCDDVLASEAECTSAAASSITQSSSSVSVQSSTISVQGIKNDVYQERPKEEDITAYPVPFSNKATVEFRLENSARYQVSLYDMKGNLVKQLKSGKARAGELQQIEVDGRNLPEGIYLVRMASGKGIQTVKLLKKE